MQGAVRCSAFCCVRRILGQAPVGGRQHRFLPNVSDDIMRTFNSSPNRDVEAGQISEALMIPYHRG